MYLSWMSEISCDEGDVKKTSVTRANPRGPLHEAGGEKPRLSTEIVMGHEVAGLVPLEGRQQPTEVHSAFPPHCETTGNVYIGLAPPSPSWPPSRAQPSAGGSQVLTPVPADTPGGIEKCNGDKFVVP